MFGRLSLALAITLSAGAAGSIAQTAAGSASSGPAQATAATPASQPTRPGCHPSYLPASDGSCVPIAADVHCARNDGKGAVLVKGPFRVVGHDDYDLDFDADGTACNRDKQ